MTIMTTNKNKKINWLNTLFLIFTPLIGIVGTILLYIYATVPWQTWLLAAAFSLAGGMSITAGYHRLFAHKTYKASWPVQLFFVLFGSGTFEGSVFDWSTDHRDHHRYTDTDKDPYSVTVSFWHAHIGWLLTLDVSKRHYSNINDLKKSRLLRLQDRFYVIFCVGMGFALPTAIAALWGAPLSGFIVAGALRIAFGHHMTFCINSLCHMIGKRQYSTEITARDNWISAIVTLGEGYHNYHHKFPIDYRNGVRFYQFDPTKWLIRGLSFVGLTWDLQSVSKYRMIEAIIEADSKLAANALENSHMNSLRESVLKTISWIKEIESNYAKSRSKEYYQQIKDAKRELQRLYQEWQEWMSSWKSTIQH